MQREPNAGDDIETSDELRNLNCWDYLRILARYVPDDTLLPASISPDEYLFLRELRDFFDKDDRYIPAFKYGDMYTSVLTSLENALDKDQNFNSMGMLDELICALFFNPNAALIRAGAAISSITHAEKLSHTTHVQPAIAKKMRSDFFGKKSRMNDTDPEVEGSARGRLLATFGDNYKPMLTTGMTCVRRYAYSACSTYELRMGTMAERHNREGRINPLFLAWIRILAYRRRLNDPVIRQLYFNNLARDRKNFEGEKEKEMTLLLEGLNSETSPLAVITLPADEGLMDRRDYRKHGRTMMKSYYFRIFKNIAMGQGDINKINDFYISENVENLLFPDGNREEIITSLLNRSFYRLGLNQEVAISPAQAQAVYFHFIKFELTNYCIEKLCPQFYNFTCKDGIDRGGVSSAYYNLIKSIELGNPMTENEFFIALHAAPTMVKGRGMNDHIRVLWNAIDAYIEGVGKNAGNIHAETRIPEWLINWRNKNAPKETIQGYINKLDDYLSHLAAKLVAFYQEYDELEVTINRFDEFLNMSEEMLDLIQPVNDVRKFVDKLKSLLRDPLQENITLDLHVLELSPDLTTICRNIKKSGILDVEDYRAVSLRKSGPNNL